MSSDFKERINLGTGINFWSENFVERNYIPLITMFLVGNNAGKHL
jgi:hypothetical protein